MAQQTNIRHDLGSSRLLPAPCLWASLGREGRIVCSPIHPDSNLICYLASSRRIAQRVLLLRVFTIAPWLPTSRLIHNIFLSDGASRHAHENCVLTYPIRDRSRGRRIRTASARELTSRIQENIMAPRPSVCFGVTEITRYLYDNTTMSGQVHMRRTVLSPLSVRVSASRRLFHHQCQYAYHNQGLAGSGGLSIPKSGRDEPPLCSF